MGRKKKTDVDPSVPALFDVGPTSASCVPAIREVVKRWRQDDYPGATGTTRTLLNWWFRREHRGPDGGKFAYHAFQREAIETLIYLYEVAGVRRYKDLTEAYSGRGGRHLLRYDEFARYCVKMATGSGKTKVMALAVAWQYFNAVAEVRDDYAKTFLVIAPNLIVLERLRSDFEGGRVFRADPVVPDELRIYWDFQCYVRGDEERGHSTGALYLTNVDQLEESAQAESEEPDAMTGVLGPRPPAGGLVRAERFPARIARRGGPVVVLNDEAHHTHDEESEWNRTIRRLHAAAPGGLAAQLDFTATPRHSGGELFSWTVFDYPLKQAIFDGVVKRPVKGLTTGIGEAPSDHASIRYKAYLTAGVERWREYREQLAPLGRKPVLFVMLNNTEEADDVADALRRAYPEEFGGAGLQVIHTNLQGEVAKRDLDAARDAVRDVDGPGSPINAIVSVVMLREGWDVQGVTVIVGLRPYTAKANILPEQTIGRGLRRMFRGELSNYDERVDVIGTRKFLEIVEQLEKDEDLQLETFEVGKEKVIIRAIEVDPGKLHRDIALPVLSPILARKRSIAEEIETIDVASLECSPLPLKDEEAAARTFKYEGFDFLTLKKVVERDYTIPEPQTAEEVIGFYARRIARDVKYPSQFAAIVPKVREFLEVKAFGRPVVLEGREMIRAISSNVAHYVTVRTFAKVLRGLVVEELSPTLVHAGRKLSETPRFPWSRPTLNSDKCVFNLVPCANQFEREVASFLHDARDVERFSKLPGLFNFSIEYTDSFGNLRYYEPDFVAVAGDGAHYLLEPKGQEDIHVAHKDRAAILWCENATALTGTVWCFVKLRQSEFEGLRPTLLSDLSALTVD